MSNDIRTKKILVTGGHGFLGSAVVRTLRARGCADLVTPRSAYFDLRSRQQTMDLMRADQPAVVIHLAASVGGIGANRMHPGSFFYDNMAMGMNVIEACRFPTVDKLVLVGTVCAYPKFTPVPFREEDLWNGYPEETNAPYGIAKKALFVMADAYKDEYELHSIKLLPVNLYGPGDSFDHHKSHVVPAMIRKLSEAKAAGHDTVTLWGDGTPSREFLYVDDCAEAIVRATESYDGTDAVNLGSGSERTMRELASVIALAVGYKGTVVWDASMPNGQPRRCLDVSKAEKYFGWKATTSFVDGINKTVAWYEENIACKTS